MQTDKIWIVWSPSALDHIQFSEDGPTDPAYYTSVPYRKFTLTLQEAETYTEKEAKDLAQLLESQVSDKFFVDIHPRFRYGD